MDEQPQEPVEQLTAPETTTSSPAYNTRAWREQRRKLKEDRKLLKKQLKVAQIETGQRDLQRFAEEYLALDGNATAAAMKVFGYGPEQYFVAAAKAHSCLKKIRQDATVMALMEKKGLNLGKFIEVLGKKIEESKTPEWWDRGMALRGERDFTNPKGGGTQVGIINIVEAQKKILSEYGDIIEGEIEEVREAGDKTPNNL